MKKVFFTITPTADLVNIIYHLVRVCPCRVFISNTLVDKLKDLYFSEFNENDKDLELLISEQTVLKLIPSYIYKDFFCIDKIIGIDNKLSADPDILYFISD